MRYRNGSAPDHGLLSERGTEEGQLALWWRPCLALRDAGEDEQGTAVFGHAFSESGL
jgi:hypothetical protein